MESYPPITIVLVCLTVSNVFIINNYQNIKFIGYIIPLIIVWALRHLSIVTIHYLKMGVRNLGCYMSGPFLDTGWSIWCIGPRSFQQGSIVL
jgi:hypothetical protein